MRSIATALAFLVATGSALAQPAPFDPADFGKIVIAPRQSTDGLDFEQAFGDYQNEPVTTYGSDGPAVAMGRPIGRLDLLFEDGSTSFCTAFLVDAEHILTNHHCVPGMQGDPTGRVSGVTAMQLVMGYVQPGQSAGADRYSVAPDIVETNRDLDYSILRVFGDPSEKYGLMSLTADEPAPGEFLWIIGHPEGQSQHISREGCAASAPAVSEEGKLVHTCDTLRGNSGSPVIRVTDRVVVGLHHAGNNRTGFNYAIPMSRILAASKVLRPGAAAASTSGGSVVDACTALWAEVEPLGCLGYETFLETCGSHTFAALARNLAAAECASTPVPSSVETVTLKADGSGDHVTLKDAVAAVAPGGRIEIYPGVYKGGLTIDKPVELVGVGPLGDVILEGGRANVLRWTAREGRIANVLIRQVGTHIGVDFDGGSAILEDSELTSTGGAVITIRAGAAPTIRNSVIHDSAAGGIFVYDRGRGVIEDNRIYNTALAGIEVRDDSAPEVRRNTISDSRNSGLYIWAMARGIYEENLIEGHALAGVAVELNADPVLRGNTIRNGRGGGIYVHRDAKGVFEGNTITGNALTGIEVKDGARIHFVGNRVESNRMSGVWIRDRAGGVFENNDLRGNGNGGIAIEPSAGPVEQKNNRE